MLTSSAYLLLMLALSADPSDPPAPVEPVPSSNQLAWQAMDYNAFVHFNINTFTDLEWGSGRENAEVFNPQSLDCRQWCRIFKEAGMRGVIITAKHHDGFCLWPSKYTDHTVASSPWRDGKGDLLRELSDACREFGLKFGVYLSPWDRNHPAYGDSPRYNEVFRNQLEEVLSNYGEVFEVWFDGACGEGPNGKRQVYDWPSYHEVVRRLQPGAVIFSDAGPGCRWVGNERGFAGETNWSTLNRDEFFPGTPRYRELTEGHRDGTHWLPAECDVSIRPGWYYHQNQDDQVKSVEDLLEIWFGSVGRNGLLLLNIPVDRRGLVHEIDAERLLEFRQARDAIFENLAQGATVRASNSRGDSSTFAPEMAVDGNPDTYWATPDDLERAQLMIELPNKSLVDMVTLREPIAAGQRIASFIIDVRESGKLVRVASGTTVGNRRILRFPPRLVDAIRITITESRGCPALSEIEVGAMPPEVEIIADSVHLASASEVVLASNTPGAEIRFTTDGSEPGAGSTLYQSPLVVDRDLEIRAIAFHGNRRGFFEARKRFHYYDDGDFLDSIHFIRAPERGLLWRSYKGDFSSVAELDGLEAVATGKCDKPELSMRPREENYGLVFLGFLRVPVDGVYALELLSDDGSRLWLHDKLIADGDGLHGLKQYGGAVGLRAGWHPLRVEYFNATGDAGLELKWSGPGIRGKIPSRFFGR